ncbi:MAG: acyl-CoA carboxylase epsilon subunit [Candidatus Sericytochromatia bacterium]
MSDTPTLRIELVSGQPSDSEQALITATVLTLLQARQAAAPAPARGLSAWQRAARQEAVGARHAHSDAAWLTPAEAPWPS